MAKRRFDRRTLAMFRYLVSRGMEPSDAHDEILQCMLEPGSDPTETELRWLRAISARLRAELGDDGTPSEADQRPLLDRIERLDKEANGPEPDNTKAAYEPLATTPTPRRGRLTKATDPQKEESKWKPMFDPSNL